MTDIVNDKKENKYWQDVENKVLDPQHLRQEFKDDEFDSFSVTKTRRNFLKIMGFTVSTMPMAGCIKIPVRKAIPYLNKVENQYPGVANYYASTFKNTPIVVKTREGRPIYVKGNDQSKLSKAGVNAPAIASVLSLYDSNRLRAPQINNVGVEWDKFDESLVNDFARVVESGKDIYLVSEEITSPSMLALIDTLGSRFDVKHITYNPAGRSAVHEAARITHGAGEAHETDFSKADLIVSFEADFLGTWGNDVKNSKEYTSRRNPDEKMNKHVQVESIMSLTGTNADIRYTRSIKSQRQIITYLYEVLLNGSSSITGEAKDLGSKILKELKSSASSLVVSGDSLVATQVMINEINHALGNYGKSVFARESKFARYSNGLEMDGLLRAAKDGKLGGVLFLGVNPVHSFHSSKLVKEAIEKSELSVSFASSEDETSRLCKYTAPDNHVLESWGDSYNGYGELSLVQPTIQPLFGSRIAGETLMKLIPGTEAKSYYEYVQKFWQGNIFPMTNGSSFTNFWNKSLHDGVAYVDGLFTNLSKKNYSYNPVAEVKKTLSGDSMKITLYQKYGIRGGDQVNNPWLQELPDPVTKATWDNYIMISKAAADKQGIKSGDVLEVKALGVSVKLPAIVQPGVDVNTLGIAVGYGRSVAGKVAQGLGANVYPLVRHIAGSHSLHDADVESVKKTGAHRGLAQTQTHHSMEGRDIVRETTFDQYINDKKSGNKEPMKLAQIYPGHSQGGHQWAMAIDMNTCTGCSSCIVSCSSENNVPVVGRQEVKNRREMHWLRIDRYYAGDENEPETVHMPMLCQHCENAPCENVCPVLATVHSSDGINQQIYNRCVGTRYCANNCPYKVRRFNWFNYDHSDEYERLALNPDISVRHRGVMEKCSFCIQRIQEGKLNAKRERRKLRDGEIRTACQEGCPSDAIVFGDMKDENSKIAKMIEHNRRYTVLEELNVKSRVSYMVKVRNK